MVPTNDPVSRIWGTRHNPMRSKDYPIVEGPKTSAKLMHNYFQNAGNGMSPQTGQWSLNPPHRVAQWWKSNMFNQEIHGFFEGNGWSKTNNTEITVQQQPQSDLAYHVEGIKLSLDPLGVQVAALLGIVWELTR